MIFPELINYLLTLRYPDTKSSRQNWVLYRNIVQTILPLVPGNTTVQFKITPLQGVYAWIMWATRIGTDIVPNAFSATVQQYGNFPVNGIVTQRGKDDPAEYFVLVTAQEPAVLTINNLTPVAQRWEATGDFLVIPSPKDMDIVLDALRRLNTSEKSEELAQQQVNLMASIAGSSAGGGG